ncbi:MAG: flagellar basal body protein [Peptococcia bacterium]
MRSTFFGLSIGYRALAAQQRALDVTSHNIANANTPGYTRQGVVMEATPAEEVMATVSSAQA